MTLTLVQIHGLYCYTIVLNIHQISCVATINKTNIPIYNQLTQEGTSFTTTVCAQKRKKKKETQQWKSYPYDPVDICLSKCKVYFALVPVEGLFACKLHHPCTPQV